VSSIERWGFGRAFMPAAGLVALLIAVPARADPASAPAALSRSEPVRRTEARAPLALVTGLAVAGLSFAVGGFMLAGEQELSAKHAGLAVMQSGLTLAPLAAHGVGGEWGRGALFSIPPALAGIGMAVLLSQRPEAPVMGKNKSQRIYPVLITVSVLGSALGIFDAALIDERMPVSVGATACDDGGAAWLSGSF
jgi:hypothetical protein